MSIIITGNFDGVHKGHARLISVPVEMAKKKGMKVGILTFSTITHNTFGSNVKYIYDNETKELLLLSLGVDFVRTVDFTPAFYNMTGEEFILFIKNELEAETVVCGDDFRFGKGASCGPDDLKEICEKNGLECIVIKTDDISSTRIREEIEKGNIIEANEMLGRHFSYSGRVVSGNHIGTELGYATINMEIDQSFVIPSRGVYATYCNINGKAYPSVTNIGLRPTVTEDTVEIMETHILCPENETEYLKNCDRIYFLDRLRSEHKFLDIDFLKSQILVDCQTSKAIFDLIYAN